MNKEGLQTMDDSAGAITAHLGRVGSASTVSSSGVFEHCLMMVMALLEPISAPMGGESSERPERHPIQEQLGDRVQDRRGDPNDFTVAVLETLLDSADVGYMDVLGEVYMRYARLGAIRSSETYPDL